VRAQTPSDTFGDVLAARDADTLIDWLRRQPLLIRDRARRLVLVHAGIPPIWRLRQARHHAAEVESQLAGPDWRAALAGMYGQTPAEWRPGLSNEDRLRYTLNALTRMRYCDAHGRLDLRFSGPPGSQPANLLPWFDHPQRTGRKWHIVFGHWSALGLLQRADVTAVDSGCVWGRELTAVPLDPAGEAIAVSCSAYRKPEP
jgi:bis(5'-nucleosyl)-tetraphosphatase (symmetrical)